MRNSELHKKLREDFDRFRFGLPRPLEEYILDAYGFSLESIYGGHLIKNPFGKASGQLSLNPHQVQNDVEAGLGFVVLKTVIAEDATGEQSMKAWAIPEARMKVEPIEARRPDATEQQGWTVTWKGRGWSGTLEEYLAFFDEALKIAGGKNTLIVPSCKYHLPSPEESEWRTDEYVHTTKALLSIWRKCSTAPMPIEKDFSPTLAGDAHFSRIKEQILLWLRMVPELMRASVEPDFLMIGLKLFNAQFDDEFQREILNTVEAAPRSARADYIIYGNRLFDPLKEFDGKVGVAYGGPDLSARNLATLRTRKTGTLPISATGDILTGKKAFEYMRAGATSFQMHTLFQLPDSEFTMQTGSRTERALHRLLFHPEHGFIFSVIEAISTADLRRGVGIVELSKIFETSSH